MEESSSHLEHHERLLSCRKGAMTAAKMLPFMVVVGIATFAGMQVGHILPVAERHHFSLRTSHAYPFVRDLEEVSMTCDLDCCKNQFEEDICGISENDWISGIPGAVQILLIILLICFSALFSGLTLGLMSLDKTGLEIVMSGDDLEAAKYAKAIYPVREDGNLLLCTLLLGNVLVNTMLSILMAEYTGGLIGLISSTFLIVIFGEIVPQALVSTT